MTKSELKELVKTLGETTIAHANGTNSITNKRPFTENELAEIQFGFLAFNNLVHSNTQKLLEAIDKLDEN